MHKPPDPLQYIIDSLTLGADQAVQVSSVVVDVDMHQMPHACYCMLIDNRTIYYQVDLPPLNNN